MALSSLASALSGGGGGGVVGTAIVNMIGNNSQLIGDFDKAKAETTAAAGEMGAATSQTSLAIQAGFVAAGAAAIKFAVDSVKAYQEHQQVAAQTEAVLKSTGGAAGVTAGQVEQLAGQIRDYSGADDEAVQASENFLLTFRNVTNEAGKGNDIFTQSTKAIVDMATSVNEGAVPSMDQLHAATLQLGKALNDPISGMTALKRVGVSFTSSQVETIKSLQESGHLLEAQKLILGEVEKEFGGAAKAAGSTFAGQLAILDSHFRDVEESVGAALVPALQDLAQMLDSLIPLIEPLLTGAFSLLADAMSGIFDQVTNTTDAFNTIAQAASYLGTVLDKTGEHGFSFGSVVHDAFSRMVADAEGPAKTIIDTINTIGAAMDQGKTSALSFNTGAARAIESVARIAESAAAAGPTFEKLRGRIEEFGTALGGDIPSFMEKARQALATGQDAWDKFAQDTIGNATKNIEEWRQSTAQSLNFVTGALQDFSGASHVTAHQIVTDFAQSQRQMRSFGNDIQTILKRGGDNAKSLAQNLISMGADGAKAAHAIATANGKDFNQIIGTWHKAESESQSLAGKLSSQIVGTLNDIRDILAAIARTWHINVDANTGPALNGINQVSSQLHALDGQTATVTVVTQHDSYKAPPGAHPARGGIVNFAAAGGFLTDGPTWIGRGVLAGEGAYPTGHGMGREWVQPMDSHGRSLMTGFIADAMAKVGGGGGGTTVVIQGDVYGMDDFERKAVAAIDAAVARRRRG